MSYSLFGKKYLYLFKIDHNHFYGYFSSLSRSSSIGSVKHFSFIIKKLVILYFALSPLEISTFNTNFILVKIRRQQLKFMVVRKDKCQNHYSTILAKLIHLLFHQITNRTLSQNRSFILV